MTMGGARPDLAAHERAVRGSFREVAAELRLILGPTLCAYLGSVKETVAVDGWADGMREPGAETQRRLQVALQVAIAIAEADGSDVARAWFQGLDPQLEGRSPARLLREGELDEVGPAVVAAGRAFLAP